MALRGDLVVRHGDGTHERLPRAALCRCGQSKNKPFCDNSHLEAGFQAAGATPAQILSDVRAPGQPGDPDMTAGRQQDTPREADEAIVSVRDNPRASRFELRVNGVPAGYVTYRDARSGRAFEHTVIATEYQGMGLASQLIRSALEEARATGRTCCRSARSCVPSSSDTRPTSTSWASHNASVSRCTHPTRGDAPSTQGGLGPSAVSPDFWDTSPTPAIAKDRTHLSGIPAAVLSLPASVMAQR